MLFHIQHCYEITLLNDVGTDEIAAVSMKIDRKADNAASFTITEGSNDNTPKHIALVGRNIWFIDEAMGFGIVMCDISCFDDIKNALGNEVGYEEEDSMIYSKTIELICTEVLHSSIIDNDDLPF